MPRLTAVVDLLPDSFGDHLRRYIRPKGLSGQHTRARSPQNVHRRSQGQDTEPRSLGSFNQARDFAINNSPMIETIGVVNINNTTFATGRPALERLEPYTEPGAAMDSSARDPPPKCHPGTRLRISGKLSAWLDALERERDMMWLNGPAGTGKSAVAQTFAEYCSKRGRLGAAFFFSRINDRNNPETVIPTIAYQLAVHCRNYNTALTNQLTNDPQLLKKALHVQLRKLIIDPLLAVQKNVTTRIRKPFVIILDGLDECEGERAQFEFVTMVNEAVQIKDLPLLWLICSRPEAHLQYTFSRAAYCGREELPLDVECRNDVDLYLRDELARIKDEFSVIAPSPWPSEAQFNKLSGSASGLFIFAFTGLKYIGDPTYANPVLRLKKLVSFLNHVDPVGSNNPMASLDLLYTRILADVPEDIFPITWRILAHSIYLPFINIGHSMLIVQNLCNFLDLDPDVFYGALRKLHSVVAIPAPEDASGARLRFYHASFEDFLLDPDRSERFFVDRQKSDIDIAKSCVFWHGIDVMHFHADDGWNFDMRHRHASLPNLKWVSSDNEERISNAITDLITEVYDWFDRFPDERDDDLLSLVHNMDFRHVISRYFLPLANWVYQQYPSDSIVRISPSSELDTRLLGYMRTVIGRGPADPATFPIGKWHRSGKRRVYFFIGHGEKTTIVWLTQCKSKSDVRTLTLDQEPSLQQIQQYQGRVNELYEGSSDNDDRDSRASVFSNELYD